MSSQHDCGKLLRISSLALRFLGHLLFDVGRILEKEQMKGTKQQIALVRRLGPPLKNLGAALDRAVRRTHLFARSRTAERTGSSRDSSPIGSGATECPASPLFRSTARPSLRGSVARRSRREEESSTTDGTERHGKRIPMSYGWVCNCSPVE
jgi:hypothetical protein